MMLVGRQRVALNELSDPPLSRLRKLTEERLAECAAASRPGVVMAHGLYAHHAENVDGVFESPMPEIRSRKGRKILQLDACSSLISGPAMAGQWKGPTSERTPTSAHRPAGIR